MANNAQAPLVTTPSTKGGDLNFITNVNKDQRPPHHISFYLEKFFVQIDNEEEE